MVSKLVFLLAVSAFILVYEIPKWKQAQRRDKILYGAMFVSAAYLGIIFVTEASLPNLDDLFRIIFSAPAKRIVNLFEPSS